MGVPSASDPLTDVGSGAGHGDGLPAPLPIVRGRTPQQLIGNPDRVEPEPLGSQGEVANVDPA
jgi:hypothetical protein